MNTMTLYTRFSDSQFLHIGTYCVLVIDGDTKYFQWNGDWLAMEATTFAYYRDHGETHFAEASIEEIAALDPDAFIAAGALLDSLTVQSIATRAHAGQRDKLGADYIEHPARVAANFDVVTQSTEHCAAWLHDVIEDTPLTARQLLDAGVPRPVVETVLLLTRVSGVPNEFYYHRIRDHAAARAVKLADIADNTAEWRASQLDPATRARLAEKYAKAIAALEPRISK
jgi:(p)ppGpp synthase/HD superfamily hydrolase